MNVANPVKAAPAAPAEGRSRFWAAILSLLSLVGLLAVLVIMLGGLTRLHPLALWGMLALVITLLLIAVGLGANKTWFGVLIDSRNRVSLSRLQMALWTALVVSAYLAMALPRSLPGAMVFPSAEAVADCKSEYIQKTLDVEDLEALKMQDAAGYAAAEAEAADACVMEPLQIVFPEELLLALGISTASFTGSTLIQSVKRNRRSIGLYSDAKRRLDEAEKAFNEIKGRINEAQQISLKSAAMQVIDEITQAMADPNRTADEKKQDERDLAIARSRKKSSEDLLAEYDSAEAAYDQARADWEAENANKEGFLKVNTTPSEATLGDMFQGDEIGNYHLIDFSKVQMFFLTIAIVVAYGVAIGSLLQDASRVLAPLGVSYPPFSSSMNTLLAISHAGYLSIKSVDQTKLQAT